MENLSSKSQLLVKKILMKLCYNSKPLLLLMALTTSKASCMSASSALVMTKMSNGRTSLTYTLLLNVAVTEQRSPLKTLKICLNKSFVL